MSLNELDEVTKSGQGGQAFFGLKDDGEKAVVRFLVETEDDLEPVTVHNVKTGGKYRKVNCLRTRKDSPIADCPFCAHGGEEMGKRVGKIYVHLVHYEGTKGPNGWTFTGERKVKLWERPATFATEIKSLMLDYNPLYQYLIEITRRGKKGTMQVSYNYSLIPNLNQDDFPLLEEDWEFQDASGSIVANKTADEMNYYLQNGDFADANENNNAQQNVGVTRRGTTTAQPAYSQPAQPTAQPSAPAQPAYTQPTQTTGQPAPQANGQVTSRAVGRRGAL